MKEGILLKSFNNRFQYSQDQSQITQYDDNPHIYSNLWHYIFNLIGVAVGFGAFWRFPYLIYKNGGGVFIIPYTISMILIGIPILYLEIGIGQMHRVSLPFIFKKLHPSLKIVGLAIMTATFHMSSVYNILLTYCYRFFIASFLPTLPFADEPITSSKYFHEVILEQSESIQQFGGINVTLFVIYMISLILCHLIVKDGAKTTGKIAVYTAVGPFLIFFILVAYGFSLDGAIDGLNYIFKPDWSKLWNSQVWVDATTQVFYQLSIGLGIVSNLSSMKPRREDFLKSVIIVPISLFLCGILSTATIFMYLSHFSFKSGISIENLQLSGPQLSFNVLPKALCLLPLSNLWLMIFFLAMILLGISSQFGVIQAIYCCLIDEYKQRRLTFCGFNVDLQTAKYVMLFFISFGSILLTSSAGIYYLQFFDYYMSNIPYTLWVLVQLYFFVHLFKLQQLISTIASYTKVQTPKIIQYCLRSYWLPGLLITNLVFAIINQAMKFRTYSVFMYLMGWIFSLYPVFLIYYYLRKQWQGWEQVKLTFRDINRRITFL